jgi:hypothetical protein
MTSQVTLPCGTHPTAADHDHYATVMSQLGSTSQGLMSDIPINASIPIYFWVNKVNRVYAPSAGEMQAAVDEANLAFHFPNNAHFTLCGQSYINDSRFYNITTTNGLALDFYDAYHKENVINVYIPESSDAAGFVYGPSGRPLVVMTSTFGDLDNITFTHELGHFFGLFHTFNETYQINGQLVEQERELVIRALDASKPYPSPNYETAADRMVSTPAEIRQCYYLGAGCTPPPCSIRDLNQDAYAPDATNFMSYFRCENSSFTPEQQIRMTFALTVPYERGKLVNTSCTEKISSLGWLTRKRPSAEPSDLCFYNGNDMRISPKNVNIQIKNNVNGLTLCNAINSDDNGIYVSCDLPKNGSINIRPTKNTNYTEGVTTFDISLISRHLLGYSPFSDPFQILAADVDNSGDIDGTDMLLLRRLILRIINTVPAGSWRFVPQYFLNQPSFLSAFKSNPFSATSSQGNCYSCGNSYMDNISLDLTPVSSQTFGAWSFQPFKVGDINYCETQYSNVTSPTTEDPVGLSSARVANNQYHISTNRTISMRRVEEKTIVLKAKTVASVTALQIGLRFLKDKFSINEIEKGDFNSANDVFDFNKEDKGELRALWFNKRGHTKNIRVGTVLLKAKVKANANIDDILAVLNLDDQILKTEFYDESGNLVPIDLEWTDDDNNAGGNNSLLVNAYPNPFRNEISLDIDSPVAGSATITLSNVITRQSIVLTQQLVRGANVVNISNTTNLSPGMLTYSITVGARIVNGTITKAR